MLPLALGLTTAGAGALVWRFGRRRIGISWLVSALVVGALTGLIAVRALHQVETERSIYAAKLAAVGVAAAWFVVIRGALMDGVKRRKAAKDSPDGRWYLD